MTDNKNKAGALKATPALSDFQACCANPAKSHRRSFNPVKERRCVMWFMTRTTTVSGS